MRGVGEFESTTNSLRAMPYPGAMPDQRFGYNVRAWSIVAAALDPTVSASFNWGYLNNHFETIVPPKRATCGFGGL